MKTKQLSISIILFAWLAYLFSYMGRANYGACRNRADNIK